MRNGGSGAAAQAIDRVVGHYRILHFLAQGGMGTVYRAEHELIGKPAAVKILRHELSREPEMVTRFFNEAKAASAIRHPSIVEIFDFGHLSDGRAYIVMEFLEGETLGQRIARRSFLADLDAVIIARGVAVALAAAHGKGIVHRDLKPDNVFLVPDAELPTGERCKVLDFGIAKLTTGLSDDGTATRNGTFMGTPLYMAPEQARGSGRLDHRADLYSLGCMLYEMVTGTPPFLAEATGEIIAMKLYGRVPPLRARAPEIYPDLEAITLRLLARDPADRFESASELIDRLTAAVPALSARRSRVSTASGKTDRRSLPPSSPDGDAMPSATPQRAASPESISRSRPTPKATPDAAHEDSAEPPIWHPPPPTMSGSSVVPSRVPSRAAHLPIAIGAVALVAVLMAAGIEAHRDGRAKERESIAVLESLAAWARQLHRVPVPSEPPPPPDMTLTLVLDPPNGSIMIDGAAAKVSDGRVLLPRDGEDHQMRLSAPGYVSRTLLIRADRDQTVAVALAPIAQLPAPPMQARQRPAPSGPPTSASPIEEEL